MIGEKQSFQLKCKTKQLSISFFKMRNRSHPYLNNAVHEGLTYLFRESDGNKKRKKM